LESNKQESKPADVSQVNEGVSTAT